LSFLTHKYHPGTFWYPCFSLLWTVEWGQLKEQIQIIIQYFNMVVHYIL
jgi:hypothetical protein